MTAIDTGRRMAELLRGCWRPAAAGSAIDVPPAVGELLQDDGLSALIWNRMAPRARRTAFGRSVRHAAIADTGFAARLDGRLVEVVRAMRGAGVEPIVTKGWAVARYYADPAGRPYADIDLAVAPEHAAAARRALNALEHRAILVDLHVGLPDLPQRSWNEVFARTQLVQLDGQRIRVLAPEDQFRWLAVHFVRHVCHRPLWLIDLAVMLENTEIDWHLCLRGAHVWRRWILSAAGLAQRLLGAQLPAELQQLPGVEPPRWLDDMTLWWWGGGAEIGSRALLRTPAEWWPFFAFRKLNPVRWCYRLGLPPTSFLPAVWAPAMLGKGIQPWPRLWRKIIGNSNASDTFATHERRTL